MKSKTIMLAAAIAVSQTAFAQNSSTTVIVPETGAASNASVASSNLNQGEQSKIAPRIKYLGVVRGPGLEFSGAQQSAVNDSAQLNYEQRVKVLGTFGSNFEAGVEARVNTNFGKGNTLNATAGNWRLLANFKNVYKDDVFALNLIPRIYLPTSKSAHNAGTAVSPDLIANFSISPKDSKFSFDSGVEYLQFFHNDNENPATAKKALTAELDPWLEADYQLTPKTQLMIAYWPSLQAHARQGAPLANTSNEIDIGANYELAKGWTLTPFVSSEPNGLDTASPLKNMQLMVLVSGTVL